MPTTFSQNSAWRRFLLYHLPAIICAAAIIIISSIPKLKAPNLGFPAFDKLAHFVEYAVFAFLTFRSFSRISRKMTMSWTFLLSVLFLSLFALLDEIFQHFVPGRHSDVYDFTMDILGALVVLIYLRVRPQRARETLP